MNLDHVVRVAALPPAGATVAASAYRTAAGGKGLNQAVAAARAGAPTVMVSAVGADGPGGELLGVLDAEGIDRGRVRVVAGQATGVALVTVDAGGENTIVVAAGANGSVSAGALAGFEWRAGDVALAQLEIPLTAVEAVMRAARAGGARTLLNPAPATGPLPAGLLALVDVLVPNEGEAVALAGGGGGAGVSAAGRAAAAGAGAVVEASAAGGAGRALAAQTGGVVVVTMGAAGSLVCRAEGGEARRVAAPPVEAIDATGAGDTYCGVLAAGLAAGVPLDQAVERASAAASLSVTREGAVPSIPTAAEVDAASFSARSTVTSDGGTRIELPDEA